MSNIDELLKKLNYLNDLSKIKKAYEVANALHEGQYRESNEKYITHPLKVANEVAEMHADVDTICASLLHDTIEDTSFTKKNIEEEFGDDIAFLVDGVTKEQLKLFSNKKEQTIYNNNKLVLSSLNDIRVMIIKLSDRMHNMWTIGYKSSESIIKNVEETKDFYVPISKVLGIKKFEKNLDDIIFKYLNSYLYDEIYTKRKRILYLSKIDNIKEQIKNILREKNISADIVVDIDTTKQTYMKLKKGKYTLFNFYIITDEKEKVEDLNFENVKVVSEDEYLKIKYGIASDFKNIKKNIKDTEMAQELLEINTNYTLNVIK